LLAAALSLTDAGNPVAAQLLRDRIGRDLDPTALAQATTIISDSGAVKDVEQQIEALVESALDTLNHSNASAVAISELTRLATAMTRRQA
jgi:geranylgeranyl diphosphate synthase type I